MKTFTYTKPHMWILIVGLAIIKTSYVNSHSSISHIAEKQKQTKFPSIDEWIKFGI